MLNIGAGEGAATARRFSSARNDLTAIAGQKAVHHPRQEGDRGDLQDHGRTGPIGVKVDACAATRCTIHHSSITMALPRVRDFRGVNPTQLRRPGNYAMGMKEHVVFLEIDYDKTETVWGMDIIVQHLREDRRGSQGASRRLPVPLYELKERTDMAKTEPDQPEQEAREVGGAICRRRAALKATAEDMKVAGRKSVSRRASSSPSCRAIRPRSACITAASCPGRSKGFLPQGQAVAYRAADLVEFRPDPWHDQGELVRRPNRHGDQRSHRRSSDAHPQRPVARPGQDLVARPRKLRARLLDVLKEEGFIRGYAEVEMKGRQARVRNRAQIS